MTPSAPHIDAAYDYCVDLARREARNFYYAFRTLPPRKRRATCAVYAFARRVDDIADGDSPSPNKLEQLNALRSELHNAFSGSPRGPVLTALLHSSREFAIPQGLFEQIVSGVEMDIAPRRYETFDDLREYCYLVASVVGLISIEILGYNNHRARRAAIDLGIAMQLANILRDLREDAAAGRVYLPQEDLRRFGYSENDLTRSVLNDSFVALMRFETRRARNFFASGAQLLNYLDPRSRACPAVLSAIYSRLLDRIEARRYDVFTERVSLSSAEKLIITAQNWTTSLLPRKPPQ